MKKIIAILGFLILLTACTDQNESQTDNSLDEMLDKEVFILGHTNYPPFGMLDDGESIGFDIDMASEMTERLGVELETKYIDWDSKQF